jgi:hypothetical protein
MDIMRSEAALLNRYWPMWMRLQILVKEGLGSCILTGLRP